MVVCDSTPLPTPSEVGTPSSTARVPHTSAVAFFVVFSASCDLFAGPHGYLLAIRRWTEVDTESFRKKSAWASLHRND